jgi:hypothetical protein
MKLNRLIPLIAVIFIAFSIANACDIIQSRTTEYISYCDNGDGTITASDKWINCKNSQGLWYHCAVWIGGDWNFTIIDTGQFNATINITDIEGTDFDFKTNGSRLNLVLKKVQNINIKNAITGRFVENGQVVYTFGEDSRFYYTPTITRLKEEFMLSSADIKTNQDLDVEWRLKDKSDLQIYLDGVQWDGSKTENANTIQFYKNGKQLVNFIRPFVQDSNGTFMWLQYNIKNTGQTFITLNIPKSWLQSAVFPIYIDPTTNLTEGQGFVVGDTYVDSTAPTTNFGTQVAMIIGHDVSQCWNSTYTLINFTTLNITASTILNATFFQYNYGDSPSYAQATYLSYCNAIFNETTMVFNNHTTQVPNSICSYLETRMVGGGVINEWKSLSLTNQTKIEAGLDKTFTIRQNASTCGSYGYDYYYSRDYTTNTSRKPYFEITFSQSPIYEFMLINNKTGSLLNSFFVSATNGTFTSAGYTNGTNTSVFVNTSLLPTGSSTITYIKSGFKTYPVTKTLTSVGGTVVGYSYPAGLIINAVKDETTLATLTFNVTIYNSTNSVSFNGITSLEKNNTEIPNGDVTIIINNASGGYEQRYFYTTITDQTLVNNTYYLLANTDGLIRSFFVKNQNQNGIIGALVTIKRFIGGSWIMIAQKVTDSSGTTAFLMNPSTQYQVEATYQGLSSGIQTITPSESEYTIYITTGTSYTYTNIFNTVSYSISPQYLTLPRTNSTYINFSVVCTTNDLEYIRTVLTDENLTVIYDSNLTSGSGGNINANIDTTNLSAVYGTFYIKRTNYNLFTDTQNYLVRDYTFGNVSFFSFLTMLSGDTSMSDFTKSIISLFVTVGIMAGVVSMGIQPMGAGVVGMAIITILSIMGWFYLPALIFMWVGVLGYVIVTRGGF